VVEAAIFRVEDDNRLDRIEARIGDRARPERYGKHRADEEARHQVM